MSSFNFFFQLSLKICCVQFITAVSNDTQMLQMFSEHNGLLMAMNSIGMTFFKLIVFCAIFFPIAIFRFERSDNYPLRIN